MIRSPKMLARTLMAAGAVAVLPAMAQAQAARTDLLSLSASATTEVPRDLLQLRFSTTREGKEAGAVQNELKQALDAALTEARKIAKPGQVDLQAGNLSVYPRYGQPKSGSSSAPQITGWTGSVELLVQGRDIEAISKLSGRINSLAIANVSYGLSREAREKAENDVVSQAIASYKSKAALYAKEFGYSNYRIGEVSVNADQPGPVMMATEMRFKSAAASADAGLPTESGKATVTVNVNGSVLMTK